MALEHSDSITPVEVAGTARERGRAHGEELREPIQHGLRIWFDRLPSGSASPQQLIDEFVAGSGHLRAAEQWTPAVVDEIRGIAEGAQVAFETLFAYNLADEQQIFFDRSREKCTTIGVRSGQGGVPISGQTMDTPRWFDETKVVLRSREQETDLESLLFTIAGIVALCGVNSAGISVWCNAVYQLESSPSGVPVACVARSALSQWTLEAAEQLIRTVPHASGQNYLVGGPTGIHALECSAQSVVEARPEGNAVWHTNHPLANRDRVSSSADESSLARDAFAGAQLRQPAHVESLQRILADRTVPVCKVGRDNDDFGHTLWAVVVEHIVPPHVYASPGPPALVSWQRLPLGAQAASAGRAAGPRGKHRASGDP